MGEFERALKAEKWFQKVAEKGEFSAHDGVLISTAVVEHADANGPVVVVLTGACEAYLKYAEVISDLFHRGSCTVYTMDLRGQGFSGRVAKNSRKVPSVCAPPCAR